MSYSRNATEGVGTESSAGPCATPPGSGLAAFPQGPPASGADLDPELPGGRPDAPPRRVALFVGDALDLVESRHRIAHVTRVVQRFLPLGRKREGGRPHPTLLAGAEAARELGYSFPVRALALHPASPFDVASRGRLLARGRHFCVPPDDENFLPASATTR